MQSTFDGEDTKDQLQLEFGEEMTDRCVVNLIRIDDVAAQMALIKNIVAQLEEHGYDFIGLWSLKKFHLPEESTCYRDMSCRNGHLVYCDIEHFEEFFKKNLLNLVTPKNLYVDPNPQTDDGWQQVSNRKKDRKAKYRKIKDEIQILCSDWGSIE